MKIQKPKRQKTLPCYETFEAALDGERYIQGALFEDMTISNIMIDRLNLNQCHFKKVVFENCEFHKIDMSDTTFENCDLSQLYLGGGSVFRCEFVNTRLVGVDFADSVIRETIVDSCSAAYLNAGFTKMKSVMFKETKLQDGRFIEAKMEKVAFMDSDLKHADFTNTNLKALDFSSCDIEQLTLSLNLIKGLTLNQEQALMIAKELGLNIV